MPIYNGYPQVYYPQQPQGQLEQLRAAQYQPQPVMMPTMQGQAAPADSGFIWVQGEAAARGYLVANGSRVLLLDADSDTFYIKEVGQDGRPFPLRIYDYKERTSGPKASIAATQAQAGSMSPARSSTRWRQSWRRWRSRKHQSRKRRAKR